MISGVAEGCSAFPKYLYQAKLNGITVLLPELGMLSFNSGRSTVRRLQHWLHLHRLKEKERRGHSLSVQTTQNAPNRAPLTTS